MDTEQRDALRAERVLALLSGYDLTRCRVLDLASRVGVFVDVLAGAGANVVGIEGRQSNIDMATETSRKHIVLDDVRNLDADTYGTFDVSLCLGILYHLEAADAVALLAHLREVTTGTLIVDTHIGSPIHTERVDDVAVTGDWAPDHDDPWGSIGNSRSWWFSDESLREALLRAGFVSVESVPGQAFPDEPVNRAWYVARVGP